MGMKITKSERGFEFLDHPNYLPNPLTRKNELSRVVSQSSAIGDYDDSFSRPGSSFLWVGEHHHLNREEVATLVKHLRAWMRTGSLQIKTKKKVER